MNYILLFFIQYIVVGNNLLSNMSNIKNYFTVKANAKSSTDEKTSPPTKIRKDNKEIFELCSTSSTHQDQVLTDLWVPPENYKFPLLDQWKKRGLKFQYKWLKAYPWLSYSEKLEGAFCKYCVVFAFAGGIGSQRLCSLVLTPFQNWKKATEVLSNHNSLEYHKTSFLKSEHFLNIFLNNAPSVIDKLDDERIKQKKLNRLKLIPIIECIILCGRQEIALRGHRDFGPINFNNESDGNNSNLNEGNFRAILKYKAKVIDYLKNHLESESRNKYISPQIQNEIITICGDLILSKLVKMVNASQCFSVLADETTDVSVKEQLTLCVRFVNGTGENAKLCEIFLKYVNVHNLTGQHLASAILEGLHSCGIDCSKMYGQGYDGASNMSGKFKGVQTIIRNKYPMALYVHCAAHTLNLAVSSSCEQQAIRNCLGVVEKMHCFFNTPKRHSILLEAIANSDLNPSSKSLKRLCATRWVERYTAVNDFVELFPCVVEALEEISTTFNDKSSTDASMLLKSMDSEFLISIQVVKVIKH
ncbi:zinc finger MYM-type protein 1-like [Aphis gossypii]|uniref:zinc finger MYM-type protein 1-like n=1 Tax=Aphis gossypii TaxID=80765 RepID=UPI002159A208|nr:zinc finger MYM-type protein 1-like [Aphis gossypii]